MNAPRRRRAAARKGPPLLPRITRTTDDPVLAALEARHGRIEMDDRNEVLHTVMQTGRGVPASMPPLRIGLATTGSFTGSVRVDFAADPLIRYQRQAGRATIRFPMGMLPQTIISALEGQPVRAATDMPGIGDWRIVEVGSDVIDGTVVLTILPQS